MCENYAAEIVIEGVVFVEAGEIMSAIAFPPRISAINSA